jgi:hypothetical protein
MRSSLGTKGKTAGAPAAMTLSILTRGALLFYASARACTVFCYTQGDTVFAGRSYDIPNNPNLGILLEPATVSTHGWFCGGCSTSPCADGMNDQGLFVAVADTPDTPEVNTTKSFQRPTGLQTFITGLLANCASVDEAIAWCGKQPIPSLDGRVDYSSGGYYTFVTVGHILVADRSGDSVVFEWYQDKLKMTRKSGRYQLMTNFLLTDPEAGNYPCARYIADSRILDKAVGPSLQTCTQVLETTAQGSTRYSLICDLTHGDVYVYLRRNFDQPKAFHLADELQRGRHEIDLDQWFGRPKPELLSPPPVIAPPTISGTEVLQRALAARGGEKAAAEIRSLHGNGTVETDMACVPASPMQFFAMRPNRYQIVNEVILPAGPDLGQYVHGFDGRIGWNAAPDGSCDILRGEPYEVRQDNAAFFGWYHEPGGNETAKCLGEARFDGELCYDLKVVSATQHEYFEYYDTTTFLLAGTFGRKPISAGSSWMKNTFGDYRAFDGFMMPMRISSQSDSGSNALKFSSFEINTLAEADVRMSAKDTRIKQ